MSEKCWFCNSNLNVVDKFYGDIDCDECGVMNSFYNPEDLQSQIITEEQLAKKEEEMLDYTNAKYQGKFVYLPKMGDSAEFDIKELREAKSDNPKFNFSENVPVMSNGEQVVDDDGEPVFKKKDLGYHIEAELQSGKILTITSMSAFFNVFKKHEIQDGDKIRVKHPEKGVWEVEKI